MKSAAWRHRDRARANRANVASLTVVLVVCTGGARARPDGAGPETDGVPPRAARSPRRASGRYGLAISGVALFGAVRHLRMAAAAYYAHAPLFAIPKEDAGDGGDLNTCIDFDGLVIAFFIADAVVQATGLVLAWRGFVGRGGS